MLGQVRMPVLVIHDEQDDLIPVELARTLFGAAPDPKSLYLVPSASHNDCYVVGGLGFFSRLSEFIRASTA